MAVSQKVRNFALPVSMILGAVFNDFFDKLGFLPPYLIFLMLFFTFCRIPVKELKVTPLHWILLTLQIAGGVAVYFLLRGFNEVIAQGLMMCVFTSVAMAAVVVAGMLGACVPTMATYSLLSNIGVAVAAPVFFTAIGAGDGMSFFGSVVAILSKVGPLLILPFVASWMLEKFLPRVHDKIRNWQNVSFWLWAVSLTIVMGRTVKFILAQPDSSFVTELWLAAGALALCLAQFALGRAIGRRFGDTVAGGQALGQKNTVLAIWMSQTYLDPLSSVGPAAYVVWQNIVNSFQLWRKKN